jgi:hypothetical protein
MSTTYHFWNPQQMTHTLVNGLTHHHQSRLTAKKNASLRQSWTPEYTAANSNIWLNGLVMICPTGNLPNFILRVKQLIGFMKNILTNPDRYPTSHKPTSPELSPRRGIPSRLEFALLLTFLISLSYYPLSLLICVAVHFMCYDIVEGFVGSCAAMLVRIFRLIC